MGRAFHRKRLSSERGSRARGTGIHYVNRQAAAPIARVLTQAELAEREEAKAVFEASRGIREWNIYVLMTFAGFALDAWEDTILAEKKTDHDFTTNVAIVRALNVVNSVANKYCDRSGVEVDRLLQALEGRRTKASNADLSAALAFLIKRLSEALERVLLEQK
jgi:hypothetical protein